ncbi:hypothetical protein VaNZ11_009385 [Volvox africanus]|uniref:Uncharacterized protein n=1 Tax=Volvox africanus TaxID=51714 RepID=A0ABQ5S778_9CHLO|nr:hypothetical protein VaNZ11_009385 [Volvox africanus]
MSNKVLILDTRPFPSSPILRRQPRGLCGADWQASSSSASVRPSSPPGLLHRPKPGGITFLDSGLCGVVWQAASSPPPLRHPPDSGGASAAAADESASVKPAPSFALTSKLLLLLLRRTTKPDLALRSTRGDMLFWMRKLRSLFSSCRVQIGRTVSPSSVRGTEPVTAWNSKAVAAGLLGRELAPTTGAKLAAPPSTPSLQLPPSTLLLSQ